MRPCLLLSLLVVAVALIATASAAGAASIGSANFTATISGTYKTSGTVTNTRCWMGDPPTYFTASGQAAETTSFKAKRGALLGVTRLRGDKRIVAGGPTIPVSTTLTRSSSLDAGSEPQGCTPDFNPPPRDCGTKTKSYKLEVYGVGHGFGFSYNPSNGYSTTFPEDPFSRCPLPEGASWWGSSYSRGNGFGKVAVAKLFNRHVKTIVVKGKLAKSPTSSSSDYSAKSSETMSWTLRLKRR